MERLEIRRKDIVIGQTYYFDVISDNCGVFQERTKLHLLFKPLTNTTYPLNQDGLVDFENNDKLDGFYIKKQQQ